MWATCNSTETTSQPQADFVDTFTMQLQCGQIPGRQNTPFASGSNVRVIRTSIVHSFEPQCLCPFSPRSYPPPLLCNPSCCAPQVCRPLKCIRLCRQSNTAVQAVSKEPSSSQPLQLERRSLLLGVLIGSQLLSQQQLQPAFAEDAPQITTVGTHQT